MMFFMRSRYFPPFMGPNIISGVPINRLSIIHELLDISMSMEDGHCEADIQTLVQSCDLLISLIIAFLGANL